MKCDFINRFQCVDFGCANNGSCSIQDKMPPYDEKHGLSLEEMQAIIDDARLHRPLGLTWEKIERMQGGKLKR